jgi:hypothetical protein
MKKTESARINEVVKLPQTVAMEIANLPELKTKHGKLFSAKVNGLLFVFRKPNIGEFSLMVKYANTDPARSTQVLLSSCLVHGDASLLDDVDYFAALTSVAELLIQKHDVELGEL